MKAWKQNTFFSMLVIIALVFSLIACGDGSDSSGGSSSTSNISGIKLVGGWAMDGSTNVFLHFFAGSKIDNVTQYNQLYLLLYSINSDNSYITSTDIEKKGNAFIQMWTGDGTVTMQSDTKITLTNFIDKLAKFNGSYTKIADDNGDIGNITITGIPLSYTKCDIVLYGPGGMMSDLHDKGKSVTNGTVIFSPKWHGAFFEGETSSPGFNILQMICYTNEYDNDVYYYTNGKGNDGSGYKNAEYIFLSSNITIEFSKFKITYF